MCDFKPGDEVVCVECVSGELTVGSVYVIESFGPPDSFGEVGVKVLGVLDGDEWPYFSPCCFRKVERRTDKLNLTEWLSQPSDFEEPKRPAKKRVRA